MSEIMLALPSAEYGEEIMATRQELLDENAG